jgi:hypothetical protein
MRKSPFRRFRDAAAEFIAHTLLLITVYACLVSARITAEILEYGRPLVFFGRLPVAWVFDFAELGTILIVFTLAAIALVRQRARR